MISGKYILIDGVFQRLDEARFSYAEFEGHVFTEQIRAVKNSFPFLKEWLEIIRLKAAIFNYQLPFNLEGNSTELVRQMERALTKNKHFKSAILTIVFISSGSRNMYLIRSEKIEETSFEISKKGLFVELFDKAEKPVSSLSNLSIGSELIWNIARSHLRNSTADRLLITNTEHAVVEVPGSSVFILKGKTVHYPDVKSGAYMDIIHPVLLNICDSIGLDLCPVHHMSSDDLQEADEFFFANSIQGIQWVVGFREKRYFNKVTKQINEALNRKVLIQ